MSGIKWPAIFFLVLVLTVGCLIWATLHYHSKYLTAQDSAITAKQDADAASTATSNVLRTVSIMNVISEANANAKQQIAQQAVSATADIRAAVSSDGCTNQPVPIAGIKRLHDYADSLRTSSTSPDSGKSDR